MLLLLRLIIIIIITITIIIILIIIYLYLLPSTIPSTCAPLHTLSSRSFFPVLFP